MSLRLRWKVARRKAALRVAIREPGMVRIAWIQELAYLERHGTLDWVDPQPPIRVQPAGSRIQPPPSQPRN